MLGTAKGLTSCAAEGCSSQNVVIMITWGASWLRYCSYHGKELISLPEGERARRLEQDLARCQEERDWE